MLGGGKVKGREGYVGDGKKKEGEVYVDGGEKMKGKKEKEKEVEYPTGA